MKPEPPEDRFVVSDRPVNRRHRLAAGLRPAAAHPLAQQRARKVLSRGRLGEPLRDAFQRTDAHGAAKAPLPAGALAAFVAAAGLVPLAMLAPGWFARAALGATAVVLGVVGGWWAHRARQAWRQQQGWRSDEAAGVIDVDRLAQLDGLLDTVAAELPDAAIAPLVSLKASLLQALLRVSQVRPDERFTVEDRLYIVECVRRYLPDTLQAYLQVPPARRDQPLEDGRTATEVLIGQLALLQQQLSEREAKGASAAADRLLQQQRFLEAKTRR